MDITKKLGDLKTKYNLLQTELSQPDATSDIDNFTKLNKEYSDLTPVIDAYNEYEKIVNSMKEMEEILSTETDADLKEMANEELYTAKHKLPELEERIKMLLVPKDANDEKNIILEVRAGTGGDEAALFAAEIFRMYSRYAELNKWKIEIIDESFNALGGMKEVVAQISGKGAFGKLKFESGVHRVQRVPQTETQGRVHTSAITVAVLPEVEATEVNIRTEDLRIDTYRSSGAGGQHVNTTDSAIRITHFPTGIVVTCQDGRSQHANKDKAMKVLASRIYEAEEERKAKEQSSARKAQVGSGDRSERIRTYNFPQSRLTDHRINLTLHSLNEIMEGTKLDDVIEPLIAADTVARLSEIAE